MFDYVIDEIWLFHEFLRISINLPFFLICIITRYYWHIIMNFRTFPGLWNTFYLFMYVVSAP
jgi:hypothetical protein